MIGYGREGRGFPPLRPGRFQLEQGFWRDMGWGERCGIAPGLGPKRFEQMMSTTGCPNHFYT